MTLTLAEISAEEWPALASGFRDLSFEQTGAYATEAAKRVGGEVSFVALRHGADLLALAALRVRRLPGLGRGIVWLPAGPLLLPPTLPNPSASMLTAMLELLRDHVVTKQGHILRLRLSAFSPFGSDIAEMAILSAGFQPTDRAATYHTLILDTRQEIEQLTRNLHPKWRSSLKVALGSGVEVAHRADDSLDARFDLLFAEVQRSKGFAPKISPAFHRACRGPDYALHSFVLHKEGQDVAAGILQISGRNATYLFGATAEAGRTLCAGYLLLWSMVRHCQSEGIAWFDLGGVDPDGNPDVARFKQRMGGQPVTAAGPFAAAPTGRLPALIEGIEALNAKLGSWIGR